MRRTITLLLTLSLLLSLIPLTSTWAMPKTGRIAFSSNRDGNFEIYVMDPDGTNVKRLTSSPGHDVAPTWSPDGKGIAFASYRDGNWEIYAMKANGKQQHNLTNNAASDTSPAWSPDGTRIAFTSDRDGNTEIYTMSVDGTNATNLTDNLHPDWTATWSPDGSRIGFTSRRYAGPEGGYRGIYTMNADGTSQTRLVGDDGNGGWYGAAAWIPRGNVIAYTVYAHRAPQLASYLLEADGDPSISYHGYFAECGRPTWAPGGEQIAMSFRADIRADEKSEIVVLSPGGQPVNITNSPSEDVDPSWSR